MVLALGYNYVRDFDDYLYFRGFNPMSNGLEFELADENEPAPPAEIRFSSLPPRKGSEVRMLGVTQPLKWKQSGNEIIVTIPEKVRKNPPCKYAWTLTFGM